MAELVEAAEVVEDVARRAFSSRDFGLGAVIGIVAGGAVAYFVVEKNLRTKYQEISNQEIAQMREHYEAKALLRMQDEKPAVEELVREKGYLAAPIPEKEEVAGSALKKPRDFAKQEAIRRGEVVEENIAEPGQLPPRPNETVTNVFEEHGDKWDYETEVASRTTDYPYVIHIDELNELPELDSLTWTYYEGDEVLCNASDDPVTDVDRSVGLSNLDKFGHGSNDPNTVYIRNVTLGIEIEVIRSHGKYEEEVLGLQHADESIRRRKRHFDDGTY